MEYMYNYLHNTDIYIHQRKDMFRINTDTTLLGEFMNIRTNETVLDVGTNNGALLLYASRFAPSHLVGIDVFQEACDLATQNLSANQISSFAIFQSPVQAFVHDPFDVVVCNPPYFPCSEHVNENEFLRVARHEVALTLEELAEHSSRLLKEHGRFYLVHRSNRLVDLMKALDACKMGVQDVCFVFDEQKEHATAILIEAIKGYDHKVQVRKPIVITR